MKIAVVGAGAIGGWLAARLAQSGHQVSMVARHSTLSNLKRDGIRLTTTAGEYSVKVAASDNADDLGVQDLVIASVKGPALAAAASSVAALCDVHTSVLCAMNGIPWWFFSGLPGQFDHLTLHTVDPDGLIAASISASRTIGCVVHASCSAPSPGHVVHQKGNELIIGEPNGSSTSRLAAIRSALLDAGFNVTVSDRIQRDIWYKLWGNMTMNPLSALTGATVDRILDDELLRAFALAVMSEAAALGNSIGCSITERGEDRNTVTRKLGAFKTSMLNDVEAKKPLEIAALLGAPREIAAQLGQRTPAMDTLHGLLRLFASVKGLD